MIRSLTDIRGYTVAAVDGDVGKVDDFFFDDETWTVRYLVVQTGNWLLDKRVLITPESFKGTPDWDGKSFALSLTRDRIRNAPGIDTDQPVSRQMEADYRMYFGYPAYWAPLGVGAIGVPMSTAASGDIAAEADKNPRPKGDIHLRSVKKVTGYRVSCRDGDIGQVVDLLADDNWAVRYLVIETGPWLQSRKVIVSNAWADTISYSEGSIRLDAKVDQVKASPPFDLKAPFGREQEERLFAHYGKTGYWK